MKSPSPLGEGRGEGLLLAFAAIALSSCAIFPPPTHVPEYAPGRIHGYLARSDIPDLTKVIPPPPAPGTAAFAADEEAYREAKALKDTPRWDLATRDANLDFPAADAVFSCALDMPVSESATPHLHALLRRVLVDALEATDKPKKHYARERPYTVTGDPTCVPDWEARMKSQSYPSGHAAVGWAWALSLAEIDPQSADAVLARGYAFGLSRIACRVHWKSDIEAGRTVGAATVSVLHANPRYVAQMAYARREVASAHERGMHSPHDCAAEARALAEGP